MSGSRSSSQSRSQSRSQSQKGGTNRLKGSGILFDAFHSRSSRSFLGSKSNLQSSSKRNLASESMKQPTQILLDEDGCDVTPISLLPQDLLATRKNQFMQNLFKGETAITTPNSSMFQTSVFGSHGAGVSLMQPFSRSVFSTSTTDMGTSSLSASMTEEFKTVESKPEDYSASQLEALDSIEMLKELTTEDLDEEVKVTLSETETICMLDIPGTCVALDSDEAEVVKSSNTLYQMVPDQAEG